MKRSEQSYRLSILLSIICLLATPMTSLAEIHHLTILHTSNHNGHFMKFSPYHNPDVGGMAARSTLINIVRAEVEQAGGHVLLLSAGDVNIGTPESDLLYAEPDFKLMKMLGYDAMALGNLDLHHPLDVLKQQQEWAGFPFLSANAIKKETGELLVDPYIIKDFDGLKVAIFGLTLEQADFSSKHGKILDSRSVIETARELVPKLQAKADVIVALAHIEFQLEPDLWSRTSGAVELARAVSGIDVIAGGNSETALEEAAVVGETLIVEAGEYGMYVSRLDLTIDSRAENKVIGYTHALIPVNLKNQVTYHETSYYMYVDRGYVEDPAVLEFMQPYVEQVDGLLSQPVGEALVRLDCDRELIRYRETNMANLVTDAMRAKTGAEIAFCNAGGIKVSIEAGPITYRDILKVLPFRDTLVLLDMTGEQIMNVLNYAATTIPGKSGFLHVSGLRWTVRKGIPEDVMVGGTPIALERMYKVVTNSYIAAAGRHYEAFRGIPQYDTGFTDASALREYIMKLGTVAPEVEGRLTIIE